LLWGHQGGPYNILAAIDQFEELFTAFPARQEERTGFVEELAEALHEVPTLNLLLILRDDHLAELEPYERHFAPYPVTYVRLGPLDVESAQSAVTSPLVGTGRSFAPGVAEELVDKLRTTAYTDVLGDSAALREDWVQPLFLQIVCSQLWSSLSVDVEVIGFREIEIAGDVSQAMLRFYEDTIHEVHLESGESEERLRSWIESTFITERGTRGTAYRGISTTAEMPNAVADACAQRHLLTAERRAFATWYQLGQDRLIPAVQSSNRVWRARLGRPISEPVYEGVTAATFRAAAEEAFGMGNYPNAHRLAQVAASRYESEGDERRLAQTLVLEGDIARAEGDLDTARESLREALSRFDILEDRNSTVRTLSALADVYVSAGDYSTAEDLQRQAVSRLPTDVEALIGLGYAQWYGGSAADAEATFTQVLSWNAGVGRALGARGQVRNELREYQSALVDLDQALAAGLSVVDEIDCRSARAVSLAGLGERVEAERELTRARSQGPRRARTHLRAGQVAAMLDRPEEAREELEEALRARPGLAPSEQDSALRVLETLVRASK